MVREVDEDHSAAPLRGLVVGNYCHDVLKRDDRVVGESLGGASSFIANVLDGLSLPCSYVSKVGSDFSYEVSHPPISSLSSTTTLFHVHLLSNPTPNEAQDRILKRIKACDSISPSDLPVPTAQFDFGLAVGVAGEISPETLGRMLDVCRVVFVDVQAVIRSFDPVDGTVGLVKLSESGFFHLLPRIGFVKASAEEAPFIDVELIRKWCCVVVTDGEDGCRVYWKDGELRIPPFPTVQIDPTGAGDSFLGGFVAGLVQGLAVPDAALLGNFFGSLNVGQIGVPKFDPGTLEKIKGELQRTTQCKGCCKKREVAADFTKSVEYEEFRESLAAEAKRLGNFNSHQVMKQTELDENTPQNQLLNSVYEVTQPVDKSNSVNVCNSLQ